MKKILKDRSFRFSIILTAIKKNLLLSVAILISFSTSGQSLINFQQDSLFGYKNSSGKIVIAPAYESPATFHNGYAMIYHKGDIVVIDSLGHVITQFISFRGFDFNNTVSEGVFAAWDATKQRLGFMNLQGQWAIQPQYWEVEDFIDGLAAVWEDPDIHPDTLSDCGTPVAHSRWGYINHKGEYIIQPKYEEPGKRSGNTIIFDPGYGEVPEIYYLNGERVK